MTILVFAVLGGVIGVALLEGSGFAFGAIVGALAGWLADLAGRVRLVEQRLAALKASEARAAAEALRSVATPAASSPVSAPAAPVPPMGDSVVVPAAARAMPGAESTAAAQDYEPSILRTMLPRVTQWFTSGNVPVKVGVVLSVFGVGFLVKEGIDRHWLALSLELRLVLVALFGLALLVLGWRLRQRQRNYALSVQGGGIAVLYLTIYAAYALYGLLPAPVAFLLLVAITLAAGAFAVLQDSPSLAVLGIVGGFMAPVLTSSGAGNHVVLFSYYAILNAAVVGIAWFRAWRMLNVLGFLFTFVIGALWGYQGYRAALFASTEPFLVLFVLMYLLIPVLFALRQPPELRGFVDGTLVFGMPIVAFGLQSQLVAGTEHGLAVSALALAATYFAMAAAMHRLRGAELRVLAQAHLALGIVFLAVAAPLALDARWTSASWAVQGAGLVWLGFRQRRKLALAAGLALQAVSGMAYAAQSWVTSGWPIVNGYYLGAVLLALAGAFSARLVDRTQELPSTVVPLPGQLVRPLGVLALVWASGWWLTAGLAEIDRYVANRYQLAAWLLFVATTAWLAMSAAARLDWPRLNWLGVALWPFAMIGALLIPLTKAHPAADLGWFAWPIVLATMWTFLRLRETQLPLLRVALHTIAYWLAAAWLVAEVHWQVDTRTTGVWAAAAALAVGAALVLATLRVSSRLAWPLVVHAGTYVRFCCGGALAVLVLAALAINVGSAGAAAPLPYVPLVNPLELATVLTLFVLLEWMSAVATFAVAWTASQRAIAALLAWFIVTMSVARAVHHWAGVPYDLVSLSASTTFQSALSIVWGVAGLAAMVAGARLRRRVVWIAGAALMSLVVVKLFLVDLGNTGTLARVVSFLGVGVLLLVVGYFAPAPPRATSALPPSGAGSRA